MADQSQPTTQKLYDEIAEKIIEQQEAIIGPIAVEQAKLIGHIKIDWQQHMVSVGGDPKKAIDALVAKYKEIFGQLAVESCKQAVSKILDQVPKEQQPESLK